MNFGTKGCMYNCGDECTGECIKVETKTKMSKRKYRIIEEKYEHVSHFYPQYKDENCAYYVLGQDENGKDIKSDTICRPWLGYQYFGKFEDCGLVGNRQWKRDMYYSLPMARHRIEMDIQEHTTEELKETIVHEY